MVGLEENWESPNQTLVAAVQATPLIMLPAHVGHVTANRSDGSYRISSMYLADGVAGIPEPTLS